MTDPAKPADALVLGKLSADRSLAVVARRACGAEPRAYRLERKGPALVATEVELDGEECPWKLERLQSTAFRPRPDRPGWWCLEALVGVSAGSALQAVERPEGLTVLGYAEEPTPASALPDRGPAAWVGPFARVRR